MLWHISDHVTCLSLIGPILILDTRAQLTSIFTYTTDERPLVQHDDLVLLYSDQHNQQQAAQTLNIYDYVHVNYKLQHIRQDLCYLQFVKLLHSPNDQPYVTGFFQQHIEVSFSDTYRLYYFSRKTDVTYGKRITLSAKLRLTKDTILITQINLTCH